MHEKVEGALLAGVHQWRGSALDHWGPRPLLPVAGRPLIRYPLDWMRSGGIRRVNVCANSDTAPIRRHVGTGVPGQFEIAYYEDSLPRGPAGCLRDAALQTGAQTILAAYATVVPRQLDLSDLLRNHAETGAALTVPVVSQTRCGSEVLSPVGVYVLDRSALQHVSKFGYQDIKEMLIPRLHAKGEIVTAHRVGAHVPRVTDASSYLAACEWVLDRCLQDEAVPGYHAYEDAVVHESCVVSPDARLIGRVVVGPRSRIHAGAIIVGPATIGRNCTVEGGALVCRSVVWDEACIRTNSVLDRCVVMQKVTIEPGDVRTGQVVQSALHRSVARA